MVALLEVSLCRAACGAIFNGARRNRNTRESRHAHKASDELFGLLNKLAFPAVRVCRKRRLLQKILPIVGPKVLIRTVFTALPQDFFF